MRGLITGVLPVVLLINCIAIHAAQRELTQEERNLKEKFRHTTIVPFKFISDYGADDGDLAMLQIRPLYTLTTKNWNFINRPIIPIIDINGVVGGRPELPSGGGGNARGLGDISSLRMANLVRGEAFTAIPTW